MPITTQQQTDAYRFFAIAFGAAPGVEFMNQIAAAYEGGADTKQIVNAFASKSQFTATYPLFLTSIQFADRLIENVVGGNATAEAKQEAKDQVVSALNGGATRGDVVFAVFNNLAGLTGDAKWGAVAAKLENQVAVARYQTEVLGLNTTDLATLRATIATVTATTDVSTTAKLAAFTNPAEASRVDAATKAAAAASTAQTAADTAVAAAAKADADYATAAAAAKAAQTKADATDAAALKVVADKAAADATAAVVADTAAKAAVEAAVKALEAAIVAGDTAAVNTANAQKVIADFNATKAAAAVTTTAAASTAAAAALATAVADDTAAASANTTATAARDAAIKAAAAAVTAAAAASAAATTSAAAAAATADTADDAAAAAATKAAAAAVATAATAGVTATADKVAADAIAVDAAAVAAYDLSKAAFDASNTALAAAKVDADAKAAASAAAKAAVVSSATLTAYTAAANAETTSAAAYATAAADAKVKADALVASAAKTAATTDDAAAKVAADGSAAAVTAAAAATKTAQANVADAASQVTRFLPQTFTLTTGIDTMPGLQGDLKTASTDGDNTIIALIDNNTAANSTLNPLDIVDGGAGADELQIRALGDGTDAAKDGLDRIPAGATVQNVETITVRSAVNVGDLGVDQVFGGNGPAADAAFDVSNVAGLTRLNVTLANNVYAKAAATTNVSVSGTTESVKIEGGNAVTVISDAANKDVTLSTGLATGNAVGAIVVTDTKQGSGAITVDGGTSVTITATTDKATSGAITVGTNKGASGAVVVTQNVTHDGSDLDPGTNGNQGPTAGDITVTGGSTISITANLTNTAAKGGADANITAGTYTANSGGTATTVTITQNAVATDFAGSVDTASVREVSTVTFGALKAGEKVAISVGALTNFDTDLTFTASKNLTAAEVAAAFGALTRTDYQTGGGVVANGVFTGRLDDGFTSGAVSGSTVTFTARLGGTINDITVTTKDADGNTNAPDPAVADADFKATTTVPGAAAVISAAVDVTAGFGGVVVNDAATKSVATITLSGYNGANLGGNSSLDKLTTLNLTNGAGVTAVTTTSTSLTLNTSGMKAASAVTLPVGVTSVALNTSGTTSDIDFTATGVKTATINAGASLTLAGGTFANVETVTVTGAGASVNLGNISAAAKVLDASTATGAITATVDGTKAVVTTNTGRDSITVNTANISKAINLGAGDDLLTLSANVANVPTATVNGGDGVNTLAMKFASAQNLDDNANSKALITNFQRLTITDQAVVTTADITIDLDNLGYSHVTLAAGTDDTENTNANKVIFDKMASGGTLILNATQAATAAQASIQVNVTNALTGTSDVLNLGITANASVDGKTITANNVETINVASVDVFVDANGDGLDDSTATHVLLVDADAVKSVVVTGRSMTLDTNSTVLTSVDASAMTVGIGYTADGAVAGTLVLGGAGGNTLVASGSNDTLKGGAGVDVLTGADLTQLFGAGGADLFNINVPTNVNSFSTIMDIATGDIIDLDGNAGNGSTVFRAAAITLADTAVFQDYANAAANAVDSDANDAAWFVFGGNTYIVKSGNNVAGNDFINGQDAIIKITGVVNLANANYNQTQGWLEIGPVGG